MQYFSELRLTSLFYILLVVGGFVAVESAKQLLDYGQPCKHNPSQEDRVCDDNKSLECSSGVSNVCACKKSSVYNHTVYDKELKACFRVPGVEDEFSCQADSQCRASSYGSLSRCDKQKGQCECYDETAEVKLFENSCFFANPVSYKGESIASVQCSNNYWCAYSALGELSRCNLITSTCECFETRTNEKRVIVPYKGKCVASKRLQEFCEHDDECRVGYHSNAICSEHENYLSPLEKVCICPEKLSCDDGDGTTTVHISLCSLVALTVGTLCSTSFLST